MAASFGPDTADIAPPNFPTGVRAKLTITASCKFVPAPSAKFRRETRYEKVVHGTILVEKQAQVNPFRALKPLPILDPSNTPTNGFPVVQALSVCFRLYSSHRTAIPPIGVQQHRCPCRCLILESKEVTNYETEMYISQQQEAELATQC